MRTSHLSCNLVTSTPDKKPLHKTWTRNSTLPLITNVAVTVLNGQLVFLIPPEDVLIWNQEIVLGHKHQMAAVLNIIMKQATKGRQTKWHTGDFEINKLTVLFTVPVFHKGSSYRDCKDVCHRWCLRTTAVEALCVNTIFRHRPNKMLHPYEPEMSPIMVLPTERYIQLYRPGFELLLRLHSEWTHYKLHKSKDILF